MTMTAWWQAIRLRDEVASGAGQVEDVQMSLFNAVKGIVPYSAAEYYGDITHPTADLVNLMGKVAVRLGIDGKGSEQAKAVWRLDQGMGGGKSHGLIGMWHLATNTADFVTTEVGKRVMASARTLAGTWTVKTDLGSPLCVVLSCDNMTPGKADVAVDGPAVTLGERTLWRLVEKDGSRYEELRELISATNKDAIKTAIEATGRPVLILVDEVMDYLRLAAAQDETLLTKDMAFLRGLLDAANEAKNCVVVMVMIASDNDTTMLSERGQQARDELNSLLVRNGRTAAVTAGGDFADIIRRRLFAGEPDPGVVAETVDTYRTEMDGPWKADVFDRFDWARPDHFQKAVARCYPFHPALIELAEHEWSAHTGFQRVRSTIQVFATTVYAHLERARAGEWVPPLIGPGDLPLSNPDVVNAILSSGLLTDEKVVASYREIAGTEVVDTTDDRGTARLKDKARQEQYVEVNPRAAERLGTALFLYSISPRPQGRRGATDAELKSATFVPSSTFQPSDADVVFADLQDPTTGFVTLDGQPGKGGQPGRHYFSTRETIHMLIRAQRAVISEVDRDAVLSNRAWNLASTGPFNEKLRIETPPDVQGTKGLVAVLANAGIDESRCTRLVVLDPRGFSLLNGIDHETRFAIRAALGIGDDKLPVSWASSAVFVCVNTQRRGHARNVASEYEARRRVAMMDNVRADEELKHKADEEVIEAKDRLDKAIRAAYQHIVYLTEDAKGARADATIRLDGDNETALHGAVVWDALRAKDKTFGPGEFNTQALVHQLQDKDLGKPLSEIRDAFWNTPRLPLLPYGETELRAALFGAVAAGKYKLTDASGNAYTPHSEAEINLGSPSIRLVRADEHEQIATPHLIGKSVQAAQAEVEAMGLVITASGTGTVTSQSPGQGTMIQRGSTVAVSSVARGASGGDSYREIEYQVSLSLMASIDDDTKLNALRLLVLKIADAIDGGASYLRLSSEITVGEEGKNALDAAAKGANATLTIKEI